MPPSTPAIDAILAAQDWADLSGRLTKYAHVRLRKTSWHTAEEIAQQAIVQLLDPAYATWDRDRHPDLFDCLGSIVNGLVANHSRRASRRGAHVTLRDDDPTHDDEQEPIQEESLPAKGAEEEPEELPPAPVDDAHHLVDARSPEDLVTRASAQARRDEAAMAMLRASFDGDSLCLALLDRMKGDSSPAADAEALGVPVAEIYEAKRRLMRHAQRIARDLAGGGES